MSTKKVANVKAAATEKGMVTTAQFSKKDVPNLINQLKEKLSVLKGQNDEKISLDINYNGTIISKVTTVKELLEISASVHARGKQYNEEMNRYGLKEGKIVPFTVSDKTVEQWKEIIAKAIHELINRSEIEKVEKAIKKLSTHLDEETRLQNELSEIMNSATESIL